LPILQLSGRHQDVPEGSGSGNAVASTSCPDGIKWDETGVHQEERMSRVDELEMEGFVEDMAVVMRREFDCWVEQCW
jgi:hypothetical protein